MRPVIGQCRDPAALRAGRRFGSLGSNEITNHPIHKATYATTRVRLRQSHGFVKGSVRRYPIKKANLIESDPEKILNKRISFLERTARKLLKMEIYSASPAQGSINDFR
jgi:hypothetical protein